MRHGALTRRACPDDSVIESAAAGRLAREDRAALDAHVSACDRCRELLGHLMDQVTDVAPLAAGAQEIAPGRPLRRGDRVSHYEVVGWLGAGGMGEVYVARDRRLDRRVALKVWSGASGDQRSRVAMTREAQAMARVRHPNVVVVFDVGHERGLDYVAMELVEGVTLTVWLEGERSKEEIFSVCIQAGEGLYAAHRAGLIHRDFKPSNVLVDHDGKAHVTDFGLARAAGEGESPPKDSRIAFSARSPLEEKHTQTGSVKGTPAYMAPEQAAGLSVGEAADQFSFSLTLFRALTGEHPFARGPEGLDYRSGVRPAPANRLSTAVRAVLVRAMSFDPRERFPSLRALLDALTEARAAGLTIRAAQHPLAATLVAAQVPQLSPATIPASTLPAGGGYAPPATALVPTVPLVPAPQTAPMGAGPALASVAPAVGAMRMSTARTLATPQNPLAAPPRRRSPIGLMIGVGSLVLALMAAFVASMARPRGEPATAAHAEAPSADPFASASAAASSGGAARSVAPLETGALSSEAPSTAPTASEPASATTPAASAPLAPSKPPPRATAARKPSAGKVGCDPPYTLDSEGRKHFRDECF